MFCFPEGIAGRKTKVDLWYTHKRRTLPSVRERLHHHLFDLEVHHLKLGVGRTGQKVWAKNKWKQIKQSRSINRPWNSLINPKAVLFITNSWLVSGNIQEVLLSQHRWRKVHSRAVLGQVMSVPSVESCDNFGCANHCYFPVVLDPCPVHSGMPGGCRDSGRPQHGWQKSSHCPFFRYPF